MFLAFQILLLIILDISFKYNKIVIRHVYPLQNDHDEYSIRNIAHVYSFILCSPRSAKSTSIYLPPPSGSPDHWVSSSVFCRQSLYHPCASLPKNTLDEFIKKKKKRTRKKQQLGFIVDSCGK